MNVVPRGTSTRSPVLAIVGSLAAGAAPCRRPAARPGVGRLGAAGHRVGAARLRARLGPHGDPDDPLQRPAADLDGSARRVPRLDRARPDRVPAGSGRHGPAELGLAAGAGHPGDLDVRAGPAPAARPRPLARRPGDRHAPGLRRRRRDRDRQCGHGFRRPLAGRPDDRCRRPSPVHRMHRLGEPRRRPPGGPRRVVLLLGPDRARRGGVDHRLRLRPRGSRTER